MKIREVVKLWPALLLLFGVLALAGCLSQKVEPTGETKEFRVNISIKGFSPTNPATYEVNRGDKVRFVVTSLDGKHTFNIDEFNVHETLEKGQTKTVEFLADKTGVQIPVYCDMPGHRYQENAQLVVR
jgi:plastocyanin